MSNGSLALAIPSTEVKEEDDNILDALPYIDDANYSEGHRQFALRLIQAECECYRPTKNYLAHLPEPNTKQFLTPLILEEHKRIADKKEMEKIDLHRYEVLSPANTSKKDDKKAWQSAISNCRAQLGNQQLRKMNLDLMDEYGPEAMRTRNMQLQKEAEHKEGEVNKLREQLYELNSRRKRTQVAVGNNLKRLGENWVELVSKNAHLEFEIMRMEDEIKQVAKRLNVEPQIPQVEPGIGKA